MFGLPNPLNLFRNLPTDKPAPKADIPQAEVGLFYEQATDALIYMLSKMPDLDEVLKSAGIQRHKLSVLLYDDEIAQACETRSDAAAAVPMRLEPSEGKPAELLAEILKPVLSGAINTIIKGRWFGYSVMEAVYYKRADGITALSFLGEKPMQWFEPKNDGRLVFFPNNGAGGGQGIEVNQQYKFFLTRNRATYENPYGEALLSRLYWPWYFRTQGWKFWGKFLERFGTPLMVGKSSDPKKMVNALLSAHSQAVLGVGPDDSVETVGATANNGESFDRFESAVIRRIQKVILGQTLTSGTDGGSGNRALGQVHETVRMDKRNSDIQLIEDTMQRVVSALCLLNGWAEHKITFADGVGLEKDRSERDKNLYTVGVRFEPQYFEDNYDLRGEDFTMSSEAPSIGVPPGGPQPGNVNPEDALDPDDKTLPKKSKGVKAAQGLLRFLRPASKRTFTANQQELEDLSTLAIEDEPQVIDPQALRAAVLAATSPEDLADRLFALIGDSVGTEEFNTLLEGALFTADVLGYVHAEEPLK